MNRPCECKKHSPADDDSGRSPPPDVSAADGECAEHLSANTDLSNHWERAAPAPAREHGVYPPSANCKATEAPAQRHSATEKDERSQEIRGCSDESVGAAPQPKRAPGRFPDPSCRPEPGAGQHRQEKPCATGGGILYSGVVPACREMPARQALSLSCSITLDRIRRHAVTSVGNIYERDAILQHLRSYNNDPNTGLQVTNKALLLITGSDLIYLNEKAVREVVQKFWVRFQHSKNRMISPSVRGALEKQTPVADPKVTSAFFERETFDVLENVTFDGCFFLNCTFVDVRDVLFRKCRFEGIKTKAHSLRSTVFQNVCFGDITDPFMLHACFSNSAQMDATVSFISEDYCYMHTHSRLKGPEGAILSKQREFYREKLQFALRQYKEIIEKPEPIIMSKEITPAEIDAILRRLRALPDSYLRQLLLEVPTVDLVPLSTPGDSYIVAMECLHLLLRPTGLPRIHAPQGNLRSSSMRFQKGRIECLALRLASMKVLQPLALTSVAIATSNLALLAKIPEFCTDDPGFTAALRYCQRVSDDPEMLSTLLEKE